ncbi:hypothetical protein [Roseicitreum antarcticum]|uniref:hypothetical protein n=1 Tax=Roseicitreum antarcticum TaxID=564137 RepID=UPI00115FEC0F|nr:hypothetical protein [Roseicitreum antarcticum]
MARVAIPVEQRSCFGGKTELMEAFGRDCRHADRNRPAAVARPQVQIEKARHMQQGVPGMPTPDVWKKLTAREHPSAIIRWGYFTRWPPWRGLDPFADRPRSAAMRYNVILATGGRAAPNHRDRALKNAPFPGSPDLLKKYYSDAWDDCQRGNPL